ncbi:TonB-dependent receptor plug domain protein [Kordia sp. SMS9]|uniref:TonB-dependent receptor domain-containing protein n=1 Tax=Kordia sp. SMS9 TaxID=2282170 RepID=UPI000E0CC6F0|nr:TonB-dependent receptor [Kordia sp. SMS9]AXG68310.1 TonB-dependent receptor plug domain protein [Kordia sp. SMS9]
MKQLCALFLLLMFAVSNAQNIKYNYLNTPLLEVIKEIEKTYDLSFSYASDLIQNKTITLNVSQIELSELLIILEAQTGLTFDQLSDKQIIVAPKQGDNKICGYVLDAITRIPIPYATIGTDENTGVITDLNGFFTINKTNSNRFTATSLGYEAKEFTGSKTCMQIYLSQGTESLEAVIISGYITNGIDRNKDGSIVIDTKRLGILPGLLNADIAQSMQLIPGISTLDESATGIQIRGGSPDQNLILYDNIKLYNTGHFYGMFSLFNPFATEKAAIFRSGTSASYGDRISGIIDISSGEEIPKKTNGGFELDGLAVNGFVKMPLSDKTALYVFARRSYPDVWKTPTYTSYADKIFTNFGVARDINGNVLELETDDDFNRESSNNDFSFADVNAKVVIKPNEKNTLSVSGLFSRNRLDFNFMGGDELLIDSLITKNKGLSFEWKHRTSEKQQEKLTVYFSEYNSFYQNNEIKDETGDDIPELAEINIRQNDIVDIGANFSLTRNLTNTQRITAGYQVSYTNLDVIIRKINPLENSIEDSGQSDTNFKNALFGEYTLSFKNDAFLNAGVRLVHYNSVDRFLVEPRINFEYPLNDRFRVKTAIERRNQPISQLIEFNHTELRLENNLWRLSDDNQYPLLSSNQISGGILYNHKNLNIDIDAYYKELEGLTTFTNGFSNPLENLEEGESTIKGLDVLLKYKWHNYKIWAGYTFNDITFSFPNLQGNEEFPGNNDITHAFRISNTLKVDNWQFSLGWQIRSGKPVTPVNRYVIEIDADGENAGVVDFGPINSDRLPAFHRLDASILYDFNIKKLRAQLGVSVLNLYNRVKPINVIYKAERKPLDDGGIAIPGTTGSTPEELEVILEQVIQRFSLGLTPNVSFKIFF